MIKEGDVKVSYVISTRNRAQFLDTALDNVREFITRDDELIVIDGGSTDGTAGIIEKHRDIVSFFISEPDCGEAHGFNKGILKSRGRYIKFLTDDDYIYPKAMRDAIIVLENHPELDAILCGGEMYSVDPVTQEKRRQPYQYLPPSLSLADDVKNILCHAVCGIGLVIRRRVIARLGLLDTSFRTVDTDYMSRLIAAGLEFKFLNIKLFQHTRYLHSGGRMDADCRRDLARVLLRHKGWADVVKNQRRVVEEVLGLNEVPLGDLLMQVIWNAERLREGRGGRFLLRSLVFVLSCLMRFKERLGGILRKIGPLDKAWKRSETMGVKNSDADKALTEPNWDGTLR